MKKIVIIGAGISGLYIANLLKKNPNYEITVYEKNNSVNLEQGYGIQLSVNSIKLLNTIGFKDINSDKKFHPDKLDFYSLENKKKICDLDISAFNTNEAKYTTLQRFTLINFLKGLLPDSLINYNKKVTQISYETENIKVTFENNTSIKCNYLILSDGSFSKTKSLIANKEIKPQYFNSIALRATISKNNLKEINPNNISLSLGSNLHTVTYPIGNGNQLNFVGILRKKLTTKELFDHSFFENRDFILSILSEISKQIGSEIIKNLKDIRCFPIFVSSDLYQPENKNTFLIGDAFFTFPPTFAQGASQSIEVAHEVYRNLGSDTNQFNNERIKRTKMINMKSKINYFAFHLSNPTIVWIRNILISYLVKNKKFINNYLGKIYKD
ncbi:FAD-dependent monooxygenase [Candidatus Pelagibacter sp.]|nr:FAD-dependent monooxygenase [Candidatus Pelagibacter sp.]